MKEPIYKMLEKVRIRNSSNAWDGKIVKIKKTIFGYRYTILHETNERDDGVLLYTHESLTRRREKNILPYVPFNDTQE